MIVPQQGLAWFLVSAAVVVLTVLTEVTTAQPVLKQIHVVTRHGARTGLAKDADTLLEEGGAALTPLGQKQMFRLGEWLRATYNKDESFLELYDPSLSRLESSNLDRTLTSANSLSMGLFPLRAQAAGHGTEVFTSELPSMPSIPVYTRTERNDVYLRTYKQCPAFQKRLADLYESPLWNTLERNNQGVLTRLATLFPDEAPVTLKDVWNLYDPIHVARTECLPTASSTSYACTSLANPSLADALSDQEFKELQSVVEQTEEMKFGPGTASNLLGSNLLWRILTRASDEGRFFLYSAHAPTLLGLLSTLQERSQDERFVDYASAIIVEVYQDQTSSEWTLRFLYKSASNDFARYLPLKSVDCEVSTTDTDTTKEYCSIVKFIIWATENTLVTEDDWCRACGNEMADVCMETLLEEHLFSKQIQDMAQFVLEDGTESLVIAGTFFGGFFVGLILMASCCACTGIGGYGRDEKEELVPTEHEHEHEQEQAPVDHHTHDLHLEDEDDTKSIKSLI